MNSLPWFRMHTDFLNDPKMIAIAFEDQRHFIAVLALKRDGVLDQEAEPKLMNRIVAQKLWIDYAIIEDVKKRLMDVELIDEDWQPLGWENRQKRSDRDPTGAERQAKFREKKKAKPVEKEHNALHNALRNRPVTDTEEIRKEKRREEKKRKDTKPSVCLPPEIPAEKFDEYLKQRVKMKKPASETAQKMVINKITKCSLETGIPADQVLDEMLLRSWLSVEPGWLVKAVQAGAQPVTDRSQNAARIAAKMFGGEQIAGVGK